MASSSPRDALCNFRTRISTSTTILDPRVCAKTRTLLNVPSRLLPCDCDSFYLCIDRWNCDGRTLRTTTVSSFEPSSCRHHGAGSREVRAIDRVLRVWTLLAWSIVFLLSSTFLCLLGFPFLQLGGEQ